ncbi:zinc ABC transporter substrate-binding protein [Paragemmobacter ruber]|uniref:High-affinity zinc uptake system protein ZnuA n=1 Tax=Paragemmobacter ruber TaxID=1985673 RepID=A0ABW9Y2T0_9RHOB|nr:zinc ABC transporter substrate-binding protein [Rhodobacter ruber]NBE06810.1 zinc ABC transporter solute-binding protein [Rhodobacter ruber]
MRYIISSAIASVASALPAMAEVPRVVTDIHPIHSLVAQVMGDLGTPELLLERGASEHDFQLRPSQAAALAEADLVVWVGPELTPWLDRALDGIGDSGARLALLTAPGTETRAFSEDGAHGAEHGHDHGAEKAAADDHDHDHDHDHGHDHAEEQAAADDHAHDHGEETAENHSDDHGHDHGDDHGHDHGHTHEGTDPHAWLDPANAQVWLAAIAAELGRLDAANAATYAANAEAASARIAALDTEVAGILAPVQDKPLIVYHDAYGYLAAHYDLSIFGSVALGDATAPGAARLAELRAGVEEGTPLCLFPEAQHDPALIEQLADGTGARVGAPLDPNGSMIDPGPEAYATLLRNIAQTMADCVTATP